MLNYLFTAYNFGSHTEKSNTLLLLRSTVCCILSVVYTHVIRENVNVCETVPKDNDSSSSSVWNPLIERRQLSEGHKSVREHDLTQCFSSSLFLPNKNVNSSRFLHTLVKNERTPTVFKRKKESKKIFKQKQNQRSKIVGLVSIGSVLPFSHAQMRFCW
jgi:hypothetical protein